MFGRGLLVSSFGWKPIPSTARVTRDEVSGLDEREGRLSGRQYLYKQDLRAHRYVRQKRLDDANSTITKAKQRLAEMKYEHSRMQEVLGKTGIYSQFNFREICLPISTVCSFLL